MSVNYILAVTSFFKWLIELKQPLFFIPFYFPKQYFLTGCVLNKIFVFPSSSTSVV
jgi:hypothetical protein